MKNLKALTCLCLFPLLIACSNHVREDSVECAVEISWHGQTYSAREFDDSLQEAREDAIEEACDMACNDVDDCEKKCERQADVKSVLCRDRMTGEVLL